MKQYGIRNIASANNIQKVPVDLRARKLLFL